MGWFWGLGAMIDETMMRFSESRTMRVSAICIFHRNLPKNDISIFEPEFHKRVSDPKI